MQLPVGKVSELGAFILLLSFFSGKFVQKVVVLSLVIVPFGHWRSLVGVDMS